MQDVADLTLMFQNGEEGENDGLASKVGAGLDPEVRMRKKAAMGEAVPGAVHHCPQCYATGCFAPAGEVVIFWCMWPTAMVWMLIAELRTLSVCVGGQHALGQSQQGLKRLSERRSRMLLLKCCFTSTETVGLLGTGAQDGHLDFHTAPELWQSRKEGGLIYLTVFCCRKSILSSSGFFNQSSYMIAVYLSKDMK